MSVPTQRSDLILPDILAEDIMKGFSGKVALYGSGAITINPGLQASSPQEVGNTVTVPYFEDGGEAQQVPENGSISLEKVSQTSETSSVVRFGKGFSVTRLAQMAKAQGRDIYDVAREKVQQAFARALDTLAYTRALACAASASMEYDGTAAIVSTTAIVETLKLFGEEIDDDQLAVWAINPKPYWDAAVLADSTGRTLYTDVQGGRLSQLGGAPVKMTAKSDMVVAGSPTTYKSLLCKRGSICAWLNEMPKVDVVRDPTADVDMLVANLYAVVHAYGTMPGGTKPGVAVMKTR
jgi:hypothetical protein